MKNVTNHRKDTPESATWIRNKRHAAGLTLRGFEERIEGITYSHMCRIERGCRSVPLDKVDEICRVLDADRLELRAIVMTEDLSPGDRIEMARHILESAGLRLSLDVRASA